MAISDKEGLPVAVCLAAANPHEVTLVEKTLTEKFTRNSPDVLIGDKAYDSDALDRRLLQKNIRLVAPTKISRHKTKPEDGRVLRRYCRRWKIERLHAWLQNYRRIVVRYERNALNYFGFIQLAIMLILLRNYY